MKVTKIIEAVVLLAAVGVLGVAGYKIYDYMADAKKGNEVVSELTDNAVKIYVKEPESDTEEESTEEVEPPRLEKFWDELELDVDFEYLKSQNEDIKAWLYSPDTVINYPVLQSDDNDYYLRRLTDKTKNTAGSLFIDYRNHDDFSNMVNIIYGHRMRNGTMFGSLGEYGDQEYYEQHPVIYLATPDKTYAVPLIAGFITRYDSEFYSIPQRVSDRDSFLNNALEISTFDSGITVENLYDDDKLLMLSTCSSEFENARYVLIGVLKEEE